MKRCPKCRRDYLDDSLSFCLEDGADLVQGSVPVPEEPRTAILQSDLAAEAVTEPLLPVAALDETTAPPQPRRKVRAMPIIPAVLAIAIVGLGGYLAYRYLYSTGHGQIDSVAVMPFLNESGDADVDYLSDGMTETLIRSLSQVPGLNVKARSSVFRYRGKETDVRTLGRELGVQAVLNGRVSQRGDQLRLSLEIISTDTENVIWTDTYDRKAADLVSLQNEIARDVSANLRLKLTNTDRQKLTKTYTTDPEAYRLYLQGRFYWNKRAGREFGKAEGYFQQAVAKDPNFALGYVGLADFDEDRNRPRKKEYILKALSLADGLAEAHASLGYQYMLDYDWSASERELRRAMELDPTYQPSYSWNAARLMMLGRYDESLTFINRALEIDPTAAGPNFYYGALLFAWGKTDDSMRQFKKLADLEPTLPWAHTWMSHVYRQMGDLAASVEERAVSLDVAGKPDEARRVRESFAKDGWNGYLREILRQNDGGPGTSLSLPATFLAGLGEKEKAIAVLQNASEQGDFWLFRIKFDPAYDQIRPDPRIQTLIRKFDPPTTH